MLDGALFIVKCARCGNPGKNACSDFFLCPKRFFKTPRRFASNASTIFKNAAIFFKKTVIFLKKTVFFGDGCFVV